MQLENERDRIADIGRRPRPNSVELVPLASQIGQIPGRTARSGGSQGVHVPNLVPLVFGLHHVSMGGAGPANLVRRSAPREAGPRIGGTGAHWPQSMITLPESPERATSKACANSWKSKRWVIAGVMSRPDWSMTVILYQVSYISRP